MRNLLEMLSMVALVLIASLWALAPHEAFSVPAGGLGAAQMPTPATPLAGGAADNSASASHARWIPGRTVSKYQDCATHAEPACGAYALLSGVALAPVLRVRGDEAGHSAVTMISARWAPPGKPPRA